MSTATQRIVTSHKEAAKRASAYLFGVRSLKLKHAEALELVARVLGVANWQTLEALANRETSQPRGLSLSVGQPVDMEALARQLYGEYAMQGWREHGAYLREDWANDDSDSDDSEMGYWKWVARMMVQNQELMPWEREALEDVRLARACGVDVDFDAFQSEWVLASFEQDVFAELPGTASEEAAWAAAAAFGIAGAKRALGMSDSRWNGLTMEAKLSALKKQYPPSPRGLGQVFIPKAIVPASPFTREAFLANGFHPKGDSLLKEMKAWDMPYIREHVIEMGRNNENLRTEGVDENSTACIEITQDRMVKFSIGTEYMEDPVSVDSDEGRGVLRDAGFPC